MSHASLPRTELPPRIPLILNIAVAFDWGEEVDLSSVSRLVASEPQAMPQRRRTPSSIRYRPAPVLVRLPNSRLQLAEFGACDAETDVTIFDFAAVNFSWRVPLEGSPAQLSRLAASLAQPQALIEAAQAAAQPLYDRLLPVLKNPTWSDLREEYFTFQFEPDALPSPLALLTHHADWLAGLLRLDDTPLSGEEIQESLRLRLSYSPTDLVVVEWGAAVVIDRDCDDTLQTIEFANLQLLEFRHIDERVDDTLNHAYKLIHPLVRSPLPFWRWHARPLRVLGNMRIDAVMLIERANSALRLVGDQYLSRLYRHLVSRFRLDDWTQNVRQSIDEVQSVYEILADQSSAYRIELLEIIVILLIAFEIGLALWGR